jgi:uncharacterized membrane protein
MSMPLNHTLLSALTLMALLGCALMAGLFFAFSNFVMRALSRLPPDAAVAAMNSINAEIVNPLFLFLFLGTPAACLFLMVYALLHATGHGAVLLGLAGAVYLIGALLVSVVFNIPRNNALGRIDPASPAAPDAWREFYSAWLRWNHVRCIASLVAAILLAGALAE